MRGVIFPEKWSVFMVIVLAAGLFLLINAVLVSAEELVIIEQDPMSKDYDIESEPGDSAFLKAASYRSYRCAQEKANGICSAMCGTISKQEQAAVSEDAQKNTQIEISTQLEKEPPTQQNNTATLKTSAKPTKLKSTVKVKPTEGVGIAGSVFAETRIVNGKKSCLKKSDDPKKSKRHSSRHIDGECCLDPDEIPNANCYYPPEKYGHLIQKWIARK